MSMAALFAGGPLALCLIGLPDQATAAGQTFNTKATEPDRQKAELTAEQEAKAFKQFQEIGKACREAGGCLIVTVRAANRDLNDAFKAGVQQGRATCGKESL